MSEFEYEPVPGLPGHLPDGEKLLWQGAPQWGALAVRAFHVRTVAVYFGLLIVFRIGYVLAAGESVKVALLSGLWLLLLCLMAVGILALMAWAFARSTIYSITDRRVVIRFGVAVPMAVNIPFKAVVSAGLRRYANGVGDIPMVLGDGHSVNFLIMWPNVRPWRFFDAQPMLRCVPDVDKAADILAEALRAATAEEQMEKAGEGDPASGTAAEDGGGHAPPLNAAQAAGR
ncbi:photosynthetic complex putative assembly protein PuhB [Thiohalocapsa sp. ML1]|uniref:photosynthetic complex putative assembly protein PuhB n=1 Tax=Thiohalocapsa sp. ML1 TaxID=1431688 RepID=UPI0007323AE8|nr:photosynthetic complex putative assembly protein PuhB [Thiohalocapsa sp. ML1]